jgi:Na+-transporting NADH:ubiquinone oxidoreductase subunit NqrC
MDFVFCLKKASLFQALHPTQKENRQFLKNEEIFCVAGLKILFTGE